MTEIDIDALTDRLTGVVFGRARYGPGGHYGPRVQPGLQLVVADWGCIELASAGRTTPLPAGQVVCQPPGRRELWRFDRDGDTSHRWVALDLDAAGAAAVREAVGDRVWVASESPVMRVLFDAGMALQGAAGRAALEAKQALALAYLRAFQTDEPEAVGRGKSLPPPAVARMDAVIRERMDQPLTVGDLASAAHASTGHLTRLCREHLGTTPVRRLWEARTRRAVDLLQHTGLSLTEVAGQCGFSDPFHLSRRVKALTGRPPRAHRGSAEPSR